MDDARVVELFGSLQKGGDGPAPYLGDDVDADAACVPGVGCGTVREMRRLVEEAGPAGVMVGGGRRRRRSTRRRRGRGRGRSTHRQHRSRSRRLRWPSGRWQK